MTLKVGRFSKEEVAQMKREGSTMKPVELAKKMNRSPNAVRNWLTRNKIDHEGLTPAKKAARDAAAVLEKIKKHLHNLHFWKIELPAQLQQSEIDFFEEQWVNYVAQFGGDILASEEFELKDLIMQDVLKHRELTESKRLRERRDVYDQELSTQMAVPLVNRDHDRINYLEARISTLGRDIQQHESAFKDIVAQQDKIRKNLTKIRTQRTSDLDKAEINFTASVKLIETDYLARQREAEQAEALKAAMNNSYDDLGSYKTFANDQIDIPILNSDTVKKNEDLNDND